MPTMMGGNIGLPILAQDALTPNENGVGVYVLELSSFQIDLTQTLDCDVSVLLNITPDHLDRYPGMEDYAAAKARLFAMQSPEHAAVIAAEDDYTRAIAGTLSGRRILVSSADVKDQSRWPSLQGPHNAQNAAAAVAVSRELGIDDAVIARALETYPGLPHRMERVAEKGWSAVRQRQQGDQPDLDRARARPPIPPCTGSSVASPNRTISTPASPSSIM
jgi:UDP-N-acetylmuramoylalanine--D-glutamate ligase